MRKIDPNRVVLELIPRKCPVCENKQHVWFSSQEDYDGWECPVCKKVEGLLDDNTTET